MQVDTPVGNDGIPLPAIRLGNAQNVTCNAAGGGANQSAAFGANTRLIMVSGVSCDVRIAIGANPTAGPSSTLLPKPFVQYFSVAPTDLVSVISNDATSGSVSITECQSKG